MKTQFRHLEFNVTNLNTVKPLYEDIFKYFEYVIKEESDNHIKFVSNESDFTFFNITEDHPHYQEFVGLREINFWVFSNNDVDKFYKEFLIPHNIKVLYDSPKSYEKNYYSVKFTDPEDFIWEVYHNPNGDTKTITQELRRNFAKEFIYSIFLFPMGFWYAYKLFFKYNHKLAALTCLIITIGVLILYIISFIGFANFLNDSIKQVNQYSTIGY